MVKVVIGDIFESTAQTLVNTVNCVGVMGKGVALGFKRRFPDMYEDYVRRCDLRQVKLGQPYLYRRVTTPWILNFPTKDHWRSVARLEDITRGMEHLECHCREWGITSLAAPPLGCGEGQLEWRVVGPTLYRYLKRLPIPVELYAPFDTPHEELQPAYLEQALPEGKLAAASACPSRIQPGWVAVVDVLDRIEKEPCHWPVGRTTFQKIAYFATESGIPTGMDYRRGSYGPYAPEVKGVVTKLVNNGLIQEERLGRMLAVRVGPTFGDARTAYQLDLQKWRGLIERLADLFLRLRTEEAEIAATVHFAARLVARDKGERPTESEILSEVMRWKARRRPPLDQVEVALAIRNLNMLGWLAARASTDLPVSDEALVDV